MIGAALVVAAVLQAQGGPSPSHSGRDGRLEVRPPRIEADATVDGRLDEAAWQRAAVLTGFSQFTPQDGIPAADSTVVRVWYSPTAIYFGIRAYQPPGTVRATLADRDKISNDDNVQLLIGTFHDRRQATVLMVNPLGVQADGIIVERGTVSGGGFTGQVAAREAPDLSPDYVFQSKGRLTDFGYEVEIRVPFKSLKYQAVDVQSWDINVVRQVQYTGYEDSWAPARRASASFLGQGGTLAGLTEIRRGLVVDLTPEATQRTEGAPAPATAPGRWDYNAKNPALGATARWGITNNLTLNATANPDFSQVEADATPAVLDPRRAISFAEKRPFFLDGLEQFAVPNNLIYTRAVVQPLGAVKLAGKAAGNDLAVLLAEDAASASTSRADHPLFAVLRMQHDLGRQSRIGMAYTDRTDGPNWNRVLDVDGRLVWNTINAFQYQLAGSMTKQAGVQFNGPLWDLRYNRNGRNLAIRTTFTGIGDQFATKAGFLSRTGEVHLTFNPRYTWYFPRGSTVEQFSVDVVPLDLLWNYRNWMHSGDARDKKLHFTFQGQMRGGWSASAAIFLESFGYDPGFYGSRYRIEVPRTGSLTAKDTIAFTGMPRIYNRDWVFSVTSPKLEYITFNLTGIVGQDENFAEWAQADIGYLTGSAEIRPTDQLRITQSLSYTDYWRRTDGTRVTRVLIPRTKVEYQITRDLFVRVIGEYASNYQDALRDETRTNGPLLVKSGTKWVKTVRTTTNALRGDVLISYRPTPGTVFYAGYDAQLTEPRAFAFDAVNRTNDAFFLKLSYLFRY